VFKHPGPSILTQCVSWAQRLGGHTAVHGEVEWLLHFGPNDSVRKSRKAIREKGKKQNPWLSWIKSSL
jgi:hypothetical protein